MQATFLLDRNELDESFVKKLRAMFKTKRLFITVSNEAAEMDETEFITSNLKNKAMLDASIANKEAFAIDLEVLKNGIKEGKTPQELPFVKTKISV